MNELVSIDLAEAIESKIDRSKWRMMKFSDLAENIVEKVVPKDSGLKYYIGLEHLDTGSLHIKRFGETESLVGDKLKIYKGDLIFAKRNAYLKRVAIAKFDAVASAHSMVLRAKPQNVLPEFLPFFMLSETFWQRAIEISVGSLSPTINWKVLAKQEFLIPPKDQQEQIAELLWVGDEMNEKYSQVLQKLESLVNLKLDEAFLFPNKYFSNYSITPLKEVCTVQTGLAKGRKVSDEEFVELPYLSVSNVQDGFLDLSVVKTIKVAEKEISRFSVKPGDVLITEGGDFDKVGRGTVWRGEIEDCLHQNHVFCLRPNADLLLSDFLSFQTGSTYGKRYFLKCAKKTSNLASINSTQVKDFPLITPALEEQVLLVENLLTIKDSIEKIKSTIHSSKQFSKGVLQQVFGE